MYIFRKFYRYDSMMRCGNIVMVIIIFHNCCTTISEWFSITSFYSFTTSELGDNAIFSLSTPARCWYNLNKFHTLEFRLKNFPSLSFSWFNHSLSLFHVSLDLLSAFWFLSFYLSAFLWCMLAFQTFQFSHFLHLYVLLCACVVSVCLAVCWYVNVH